MSVTGLLVVLLVLVLVAVFAMLNWFAPALVALRGVQRVRSDEALASSRFATGCRSSSTASSRSPVCVIGVAIVVVAFAVGEARSSSGNIEGAIGTILGLFVILFAAAMLVAVIVGPIDVRLGVRRLQDTVDDDDATETNPAYR